MDYIEVVKNTKNNGELLIKEIDYDAAKKMTIENHYSKKWNTAFGKINFGIYRDNKLMGCAVFGNLMNTKSYKNITTLGKESVIELNRMWIDDQLVKNAETVLISSCIKIIKNVYPHIKYIQSFADGRLGCGTIYKAANFKYFGYNKSLFFEDVETLECFHKVPLENTNRPYGFLHKNRRYLDGKLRSFYVKTYRYIYVLDKKNPVLLKEMPYPEYEKGEENVGFQHPIGVLTRLAIMYNLIGDTEYALKSTSEIKKMGFDKSRFKTELNKQNINESIVWFQKEYMKSKSNIEKLKVS